MQLGGLESFSSFCRAASTVMSIGTLVNNDSTSKDTITSEVTMS